MRFKTIVQINVPYYTKEGTVAFDVVLEKAIAMPPVVAPGMRLVFGEHDDDIVVTEVEWLLDCNRLILQCNDDPPPAFRNDDGTMRSIDNWNMSADAAVCGHLSDGFKPAPRQEVDESFWSRPELRA